MTEPVQHGKEWWTRATDGSWLRWNAQEYRWDPQPGAPPFPASPPEPPAPPAGLDAGAIAPPAAPATPDRPPRIGGGRWDAPPPPPKEATAPESDAEVIARRLRAFDPADGKALVARALVGVTSLVSVVTGAWLFQRAVSDTAIFTESATLNTISAVALFALLASGIAVIVWFKGAYDNVTALGATDLRYSPGWAIGGWFIPIGNLFIPKQITDDLWRTTDPTLPAHAGAQWKFRPVAPLLHFWWALWVLQGIMTVVASGLSENAVDDGDIDAFKVGIGLEGTTDILIAASGLFLIKIIGDITTRQRDRSRGLAAQTEQTTVRAG